MCDAVCMYVAYLEREENSTDEAIVESGSKAKYLPNLLTCFLSLLSFLRASTSMQGRPLALASSQWEASPRIHTFSFGRGMCRSLYRGGEGRGGEGRGRGRGRGRGGEGRGGGRGERGTNRN